jgi:glycosyltransferase involved in cell wall biosynthesis
MLGQSDDGGNLRILADTPDLMNDGNRAEAGLPRLLYLGDVPVEASYHGSALLYRLLQTYPADKLAIVEAGTLSSLPERRLAGVHYHTALLPLTRLYRTRFASWYEGVGLCTASLRAGSLEELARTCRPDAILTVTHGFPWITAAEIARRLDVPLHLICHDEWARTGVLQGWRDREFGRHYRAAASRLCVSPYMALEYARRYGVEGSVLYPSRALDGKRYDAPPPRLRARSGPLTCVFAGTINSRGIVAGLMMLARCLQRFDGRLVIYGPLTSEAARAGGLEAVNIELGGLFPSSRLMEKLREVADVLFVPMSFDAADRSNMKINFPSKLTDYTSVGLPLLIYGPPYCSAVQWALENPTVAEVVTLEDERALSEALLRMARDPRHLFALAENALAIGEACFSYRTAIEVFYKRLKGNTRGSGNDAAARPCSTG